jgi:hypothetical protein
LIFYKKYDIIYIENKERIITDMDSIESLIKGILNANPATCDKVGRDRVGAYTIDTCHTCDQGWETAVWKDEGEIIIVARYETKEEAQIGHEDWISVCKLNPTSAWSVQCDEYINF